MIQELLLIDSNTQIVLHAFHLDERSKEKKQDFVLKVIQQFSESYGLKINSAVMIYVFAIGWSSSIQQSLFGFF